MVVRLWLIMMVLIIFTVVFMWIIQIFILEKNYVDMAVKEIQECLEPVMTELATEDLAENENLIPYLSKIASGKMFLVNGEGKLVAMYSYGHPINLEEEKDITIWKDIQVSDSYEYILDRKTYSRYKRDGSELIAYEIGIPAWYYGKPAFVVLYQSFSELYKVIGMNRRLLVVLSIMLTIISSIIAAILSRKFVKPIHEIKETVDELTEGNLEATIELRLKDEIGQLAESVKKLGKALQRVDSLRREVIANVSHELRSPLALIGGYAELVRDIHWRDDKKRQEDLDLIMKESRRMSEMVSDILDYSQLQAGYLQLRKDWYNLYEIVESEVLLCGQSAMQYEIKIQLISIQKEIMVYIDALKISQVIRNLLNNAVNHTKDGLTIIVEIEDTEKACKVCVKNKGEPIPEEEKKLIWERYQRNQHQGGRKEGTGLGLSIVSAILKAHKMMYNVDYQDGMIIFWFEYEKEELYQKIFME